MKQQTVWHWTCFLNKEGKDFLKVGVIHNKSKGVKDDIISIQFKSSVSDGLYCQMRVDEAVMLCAGIMKTLARMIYGSKENNELFIESSKLHNWKDKVPKDNAKEGEGK